MTDTRPDDDDITLENIHLTSDLKSVITVVCALLLVYCFGLGKN